MRIEIVESPHPGGGRRWHDVDACGSDSYTGQCNYPPPPGLRRYDTLNRITAPQHDTPFKSGLPPRPVCLSCARGPHPAWHDMIRLRCISCFPPPRASTCAQPTPSHAATPPAHLTLPLSLATHPCGCSKPHHLAHHPDLKSMSPWRWLSRPQPSHMPLHPLGACVMPPRAWRVGAQTTRRSAAVAASAALRAL